MSKRILVVEDQPDNRQIIARSRSSPSRLMRSAAKKRRRVHPAAMITFLSPSARVNYWRKLGNI
jgi:CheY-like chemotaxis protein